MQEMPLERNFKFAKLPGGAHPAQASLEAQKGLELL